MKDSITYFTENVIPNLENIFLAYSADMTKMAELVKGVMDNMLKLGLQMIAEEIERYDKYLHDNRQVRPDWHVVRKDSRTLLTRMGTLQYKRTLFHNKKTGAYEYLLDRTMGISPNARMTEDVEADMLLEAVQTSYEKAGNAGCMAMDRLSRETVKDKIHGLKFPKYEERPEEKKTVEYLYVDADEDHVSLQFREKKGDLAENGGRPKKNHAITKLIYVYEGKEKVEGSAERYVLKNPHYFCRSSAETENKELWKEVYEYIENTYDVEKIKKIYLNADGGSWIIEGKRQLGANSYVLDGFHLAKYKRKIINCFLDTKEAKEKELIRLIKTGTKAAFREKAEEWLLEAAGARERRRIRVGSGYLLSNWTAARKRLCGTDGVEGSSTESHVSHVLSSRMSSRPMGWSHAGMGKMAQLRAYYYNHGDMLELVRYQKKEELKEESREVVYSSSELWKEERKRRRELGAFADRKVYDIPYPQIKKIANFKNQIFGL